MNRIQFIVLTALSILVVLLLSVHIWLAWLVGKDQRLLARAQQQVNEGEASQKNWKQMVIRIYQDSQKSQDQNLKDIITRQQITINPATENNGAPNPMVAPTNPASSR